MPEALACPNCSAPLTLSSAAGDPPVVTCRYCASQVMVRELEQLPAEVDAPAAFVGPDADRLPRQTRPVSAEALEQVARLARSAETQAAIRLYRETQDSSRLEAQQVVERLRLDPQAQPDWVVEQVDQQLQSTQAPEVKRPGANCGNRVVVGMAILLVLALLISLLVFLFSGLS